MKSPEEKIIELIDEKYVVKLLRNLVQIPSINPPGDYNEISSFIIDEIKSYGADVQIFEHYKDRPNIVCSLKNSDSEPTLLIDAHFDTVPPYNLEKWKYDPFSAKIVDGAIFGRGTTDCKGCLAAMMAATKALVEADCDLQGNLLLVAWADDEWRPKDSLWFNGESYLAKNKLITADMAIFGEPYDLKVIYMSKGRVWFEFNVEGKACHSAAEGGVNAIVKALKLVEAIYSLKLGTHPIAGKDTINVGTIRGGDQTNMVPDWCTLSFDIRFSPPLTATTVEQKVTTKLKELKTTVPDFVLKSVKTTQKIDPIECPIDAQVIKALMKAGGTVLGKDPELGGAVSFGDVAEWKELIGLKEFCMFGPGALDQAHAINEHILINDLIMATKMYALAAFNSLRFEA
jgi:acetylornithine deacetylase/succinyl-diaminopimelate desuccinylase family protein